MLDAEFLEKIEEMAKPVILDVNGSKYSSKNIVPVFESTPLKLPIQSLTGIVDFILKSGDVKVEDVIVHIVSHNEVAVYSKLFGNFKQRDCYAFAKCEDMDFTFGKFYDSESFNIAMQACFTEYDQSSKYGIAGIDKADVLKFSRSVCARAEAGVDDDGITQEVTVKTSIVSKENAVLPNPVKLCPYRTFAEIEQPESSFVFRVNNGLGFALFEADGGAWKNEARKRIKEYLTTAIPNLVVIA